MSLGLPACQHSTHVSKDQSPEASYTLLGAPHCLLQTPAEFVHGECEKSQTSNGRKRSSIKSHANLDRMQPQHYVDPGRRGHQGQPKPRHSNRNSSTVAQCSTKRRLTTVTLYCLERYQPSQELHRADPTTNAPKKIECYKEIPVLRYSQRTIAGRWDSHLFEGLQQQLKNVRESQERALVGKFGQC